MIFEHDIIIHDIIYRYIYIERERERERSLVSRFHSDSAQHIGMEHMIQLVIRNFQDTSALYFTDLFHGDI